MRECTGISRQAQAAFDDGSPFAEFVGRSRLNVRLMQQNYRDTVVPETFVSRLCQAADKAGGLRVLVWAEDWCPDTAENLPVVARMFSEVPGAEVRVLRKDQHSELARALGGAGSSFRIPLVVVFDGSFCRHAVWVERPRAAHEVMAAEGKERGRRTLRKLYRSGDMRLEVMKEITATMEEQGFF